MTSSDTSILLQHTLDSVSDVFIILDREWRFLFLNSAAAVWFKSRMDVDAGTIIGRVLWDVAPQIKGTRFEREYRAAAQDNRPRSFEAFFDARNTWYDVRVYPAPETIAMQVRDVTREKHRQEFLTEASRVLNAGNTCSRSFGT